MNLKPITSISIISIIIILVIFIIIATCTRSWLLCASALLCTIAILYLSQKSNNTLKTDETLQPDTKIRRTEEIPFHILLNAAKEEASQISISPSENVSFDESAEQIAIKEVKQQVTAETEIEIERSLVAATTKNKQYQSEILDYMHTDHHTPTTQSKYNERVSTCVPRRQGLRHVIGALDHKQHASVSMRVGMASAITSARMHEDLNSREEFMRGIMPQDPVASRYMLPIKP